MHNWLTLDLLARGEVAEVAELVGPPEHLRRLAELGVRHGARLEVLCSGSPCIVRVGGSTLCLRDDERVRIFVTTRKTA